MTEEKEVVVESAAGTASDNQNKRKLEALEPESLGGGGGGGAAAEFDKGATADNSKPPENEEEDNESEAKRPRLDEDGHAAENGHETEKVEDETKTEESDHPVALEDNIQSGATYEACKEASEAVTSEQQPAADEQSQQAGDLQQPSVEDEKLQDETDPTESEEVGQQPSEEVAEKADEQQLLSETQTTSRKIEVPNNKVGVLIGKAGDTIRYLQYNSGAKIQITRDADADPRYATRPVELIGTPESINKAEKLINDVIAEADMGGSPSLVARGFSTVQAIIGEQLEIQVPNDKVGLIIGKGGETIKNLQTKSGARIQLIPQHSPEGDQSKEKTLRITGDKKQIEMAREMIKEVMNQTAKPSPLSSGYGQQGFRPRGPVAPQWGHRGAYPAQFTGYDHQQRGPYPSQSQQYPPPTYGNYPPQSAPRGSFGPGWEQRPPMQGPPPQPNYNYGQSHSSEYGQPGPYTTQTPMQSYGHGYNDGHSGPQPHPYGGHGGPQQTTYYQGGAYPGYGSQDQYGKPPPSYGMPPQAPHAQSYSQPRPNQPGTQSYGPNVPPQQSYPYVASGPMQQQSYPAYGSAPVADGYSQSQPTAAAASAGPYTQQGSQPVSGYAQPGGQQPTAFGQVGAAAAGGYGSYPSQPVYTDQAAATTAGYGYQAPAETGYATGAGSAAYASQPAAQTAAYGQPAAAAYDTPAVAQPGAYGAAPTPAAYAKSALPQPGYPQYDSSQTYGVHR